MAEWLNISAGNSLFLRHKQTGVRWARVAAGGDYPSGFEWCHRFVVLLTSRSTGGITATWCACRPCPREARPPEEQIRWPGGCSSATGCLCAPHSLTERQDAMWLRMETMLKPLLFRVLFDKDWFFLIKSLINHRGVQFCNLWQQLFGILSNCLHLFLLPEPRIHRWRARCVFVPTTCSNALLWCSLQGTEEPDRLRQSVLHHGQRGKSNSQQQLGLRSSNM